MVQRPIDVYVHDVDEVRAWVLEQVEEQVRLGGQPHPQILLVGDGFVRTLDLHELVLADPGAHPGATWAALLERERGIELSFLVLQLHTGGRLFAVVVQWPDASEVWWSAIEYLLEDGVLGTTVGSWDEALVNVDGLPGFLADLLRPPEGVREAIVGGVRTPVPDIKAAFGELPEGAPLPVTAADLAELAAALAQDDVQSGQHRGTVVIRTEGHHWEYWVLGGDLPAPLDDMVRVICSRGEVADGVAIVLLAPFPGSTTPQPGVQIVAERAGERFERWALLSFPQGAGEAPVVAGLRARPLPIPDGEGWLGVDPVVDFDLGPIGVVAEA